MGEVHVRSMLSSAHGHNVYYSQPRDRGIAHGSPGRTNNARWCRTQASMASSMNQLTCSVVGPNQIVSETVDKRVAEFSTEKATLTRAEARGPFADLPLNVMAPSSSLGAPSARNDNQILQSGQERRCPSTQKPEDETTPASLDTRTTSPRPFDGADPPRSRCRPAQPPIGLSNPRPSRRERIG